MESFPEVTINFIGHMFVLSYMHFTFWNLRHRLVRHYWYIAAVGVVRSHFVRDPTPKPTKKKHYKMVKHLKSLKNGEAQPPLAWANPGQTLSTFFLDKKNEPFCSENSWECRGCASPFCRDCKTHFVEGELVTRWQHAFCTQDSAQPFFC